MCGIAGFIGFDSAGNDPAAVARAMADAVRHRGPDDDGIWVDAESQIALAHRRLSIVDLSPQGHQPMWSHSRRLGIVFNGEIYNHRTLRAELDSRAHFNWRGPAPSACLRWHCGMAGHARFRWRAIAWGKSRFITAGPAARSCLPRS
jgi:asparagine synthase (glutamine-hydrolysing)